MSKPGISNAGAGKALLHTRIRLELQAVLFAFWVGFLPVLLVPCAIWLYQASPMDIDLLKIHAETKVFNQDEPIVWHLRDASGVDSIVAANTTMGREVLALTPQQVKFALGKSYNVVNDFFSVLLVSFYIAFFVFGFVWFGIYKYGRHSQQNRRIRGAQPIVDAPDLNVLIKKHGAGPYSFAQVKLPRLAPTKGILALGAQGSGKSIAIHDLMQQVMRRNKKCIIYDQNGEFFRAYYRPGKDYFFNPALEGSVPWSIFSELKFQYDADTLAQAFLPSKGNGMTSGPNAFFEDAARALFSVILLRLTERGAINTQDIAKAFLEMPDEDMNHLIEKSIASSAIGGDSKAQRQGVISSIAIYLNGIAAVKPGKWSIADFINSDDDARLFILSTDDTRAMFAPLYRLILTVTFALIASKQEVVHEDRYWLFLDEVYTLGEIKLEEHMNTMRKYGLCVVAGAQSESQFQTTMGKDRSESLMNAFNTLLQLRVNETNMLERAAKRLGKMEVLQVSQNQQLGVSEWRDGTSLNFQEHEKHLVMPAELSELGECQGFLKLAGNFPVGRVNYYAWLKPNFFGKRYVDRFAEKISNPPRDPAFKLDDNRFLKTDQDVLAMVKKEVLERQREAGKEATKEQVIETQPIALQSSRRLKDLDRYKNFK